MKTFCRVGIPAPNNQLISSAKCQRALGGLVMGLLDNSRAPCEVSREIEYDEQRAMPWLNASMIDYRNTTATIGDQNENSGSNWITCNRFRCGPCDLFLRGLLQCCRQPGGSRTR